MREAPYPSIFHRHNCRDSFAKYQPYDTVCAMITTAVLFMYRCPHTQDGGFLCPRARDTYFPTGVVTGVV